MISLYAQAWWYLIRFDIVLLSRGFPALYYSVKNHRLCKVAAISSQAELIVTVFEVACIWYPKQVRCLQRSAALTCMLRDRGVAAQMVIGTQKLPFKAHAWVEVNECVVSDKKYTPDMYAILDRC